MSVTYTVAVDLNDDGDFVDVGEILTADVLALEWRLGLAQPFDSLAAPISARITLCNIGQSYSPEFTATGLTSGKSLRIQSHDGVTLRTHFTGMIDHIEPMPGTQSQRTAVIVARGPEHDLAQNRVRLAPQINVRADQVIQSVIDTVRLRRAVLNGYCLVDVPGYNLIGTARLLGVAVSVALESGKSSLAYVADTWGEGISADEAIRQVTESERGRFFISRSGVLTFFNRYHNLLNVTPVAAFADNMEGLDYNYGANIVNRVQVRVIPRTAGAPGSVLWQLGSALLVTPGQTRQIVARYRDADKRPIGAATVLPLLPGFDFFANTRADGTGTDRTAQAIVVLSTPGTASAATIEVRNNTSESFFILPGMQVRGTPLNQADPVTVEQADYAGMNFYGVGTIFFDLPALNSPEDAFQFARYELSRRKDPQGIVRSIQVSSASLLAQVLTRTLFDRITVQESQTDHNREYFIVAEDHRVDLGSFRHTVTWLLEPADSDIYFIIGLHKPDGSRSLAY